MTVVVEGQLEFTFPAAWGVTVFDAPGTIIPKGIQPVDFVVDRGNDVLLIEVKDPSHTRAPHAERARFLSIMQSQELTNEQLVPKARTSWSYLHLMGLHRQKPLIFIAVIGTENLSIEPMLLQGLTDRLNQRLQHEADDPWVIQYVQSGIVVAAMDLPQHLAGVGVKRLP
jgi:hypothetical protein